MNSKTSYNTTKSVPNSSRKIPETFQQREQEASQIPRN